MWPIWPIFAYNLLKVEKVDLAPPFLKVEKN